MTTEKEPLTPELMLAFYRRLYPFKSVFNWLNHEHTPTKLFTQREFAFTLQGDVYLRYQSFLSVEELKKQVCTMNPTRFEIGPMYSARPRDRKTVRPGSFTPLLRELVFDIDMTDYDSIRTCCSDAAICNRCWAFISIAVRVLDQGIRDQFGYKHLLWVYSGRRGIHLWISDKEAMALTDEQRKALVGWMTVIQGGKEMHKKVNVRVKSNPLPPSINMALDTLRERFVDLILIDQECFQSESGYEELLKLIPDNIAVSNLRTKWRNTERSSKQKWTDIKKEIRNAGGENTLRGSLIFAAMEDIILQYTYPRLDAEVSKHRNHLLKAPFCIHPKTGRVCVPVDPRTIEKFNPENVPTINQLLQELDLGSQDATQNSEHHSDWEKTSLKPYVELMDRHVLALMEEVRKSKRGAGSSQSSSEMKRLGASHSRLPCLLGEHARLSLHATIGESGKACEASSCG
ncbi:hypothetical protein PHLCEN_2v6687 [Hermanssonia centrifuga]|uniref:DNA primase n=1 Tax=Hermanssonia centrifuga TaxID=98765 RepID=A0A2R6NYN1_9APHY|nr:hypothetical protein PHLCEN_2v6687 [Hermanssonia centrifuga]